MTALDIAVKDLRHPVISYILIIQEHCILIIYQMFGNSMKVFKRLFVADNSGLTRERFILEPDELKPAMA